MWTSTPHLTVRLRVQYIIPTINSVVAVGVVVGAVEGCFVPISMFSTSSFVPSSLRKSLAGPSLVHLKARFYFFVG